MVDFRRVEPIFCDCCGKNLMDGVSDYSALVAWKTNEDGTVVEDVYFACKGDECDRKMSAVYGPTSWEDISDLAIPAVFIDWMLSIMTKLHDGHTYSDKAFEKIILLAANLSNVVTRDMTEAEEKRFRNLQEINNY